MIRRYIIAVCTLVFVLGPSSAVFAHPDIAVSVRLTFAVQGSRLASLSQQLVFDVATSRRLLARFDTDRNGMLSATEEAALADELLSRLLEHDAYTELTLDHHRLVAPDPKVSEVRLQNGLLVLRLDFRFAEAPDVGIATLGVLMRDRDLVIAFRPDPAMPAIVASENAADCVTRVERRPDEAYFGGLVTPSVVTLRCRQSE
jgi:ABC-type uncharacterized transport system substrate-binding protein